MHILLISRCPPYPLHLGDRLIIWHLVRELTQRGITFDLLAFAQFDTDWDEQAHYAHLFRHITLIRESARPPQAYLQRVLNPATRFPRHAENAWSPEMWQAIEARLQAETYTAVHLFGSVQVYEFYHALRGLPALITPYESFSLFMARHIAQHGGILNRARRLMAQQLERFMFTPYARTTVVAPPDKDELLRLNPALPIDVIGNGIDLAAFPYRDALPAAPTLLFVGNYEYVPNVDAAEILATRILPQVRDQMPDAHLMLVGNAPLPALQALANDHITVTGRVPDIRPYHEQAAVFVCPLRVGAGIKNKVLEALAVGVPVVATPLSVDGIAVEHNTSAIITDVDHFAPEIVRLLRDAALQAQLARNGRTLIENHYSWSSQAAKYLALYATLSGSSNA